MTKAVKTIPAFSLARQVSAMRPQLIGQLEKVVDSQQFIGGQFIESFEKQLAAYLQAKFVISCNSGTDALYMALLALNLPKNAIVLTTPFSFIASSTEIVANEAHPVFIDIEPETFNINPALVAQWLDQNAVMRDGVAVHRTTGFPVVGILPVDIFGQCADYNALNKIAQQWNLWIVEDCAQSLGAVYNGKKAGTLGVIGATSFYPTKNLGAFGDAGCCITDDAALAEKLLEIRHHGRKKNYEYQSLGINSRLDAFQAVILSEKLTHLDTWNDRRRAIAERYHDGMKTLHSLRLPAQLVGTHVFHQYSILIDYDRETFIKYLADHGIQTRIFYPEPLQSIAFLRTNPALSTVCPVADYATRSIVSLPMWPELEDAEVDYVIDCVNNFCLTHAIGAYSQQTSCCGA